GVGARAVSWVFLRLADEDRRRLMVSHGDGWFELETAEARSGSRYCFELPDGTCVPDPASRRQDRDVGSASIVVDPAAYRWRHPDWRGRPPPPAPVFEPHVGRFSPPGRLAARAPPPPALQPPRRPP